MAALKRLTSWTHQFRECDLRKSKVILQTKQAECCLPWCGLKERVQLYLPSDTAGLKIFKMPALCNAHLHAGPGFARMMDMEMLQKYDFTQTTVSGNRHSRVLKYTGLPSPTGNPMSAWVVVFWSDSDQVPEQAGDFDQVYDEGHPVVDVEGPLQPPATPQLPDGQNEADEVAPQSQGCMTRGRKRRLDLN